MAGWLQISMARSEDIFRHTLTSNTIPLDPERLRRSSGSVLNDPIFKEDHSSFDWDEESTLDLIHPDAVIDLWDIAEQMIQSDYEKECCQAYCSIRRDVLDKHLLILGVEKSSIGEVQRMEWQSLDDKISTWIQVFRLVVRGLLSSEKRLCDQIFRWSGSIKDSCFLETSKGCVMQFLNFAEAVAIGSRSGEKLFKILDMYEALSGLIPDLQALFMDGDAGDMVCIEAKEVLDALGEAAVANLVEFQNAAQTHALGLLKLNGEIQPITRHVVNYAKILVDYSDTLDSLLETVEDNWGQLEKENDDNLETTRMSQRLSALIASLESNLEEKSRTYEDEAMQHIFLMNHILYIVQKVKGSRLSHILGADWIKRQQGLIKQHATHYRRATWSKALSCLETEGIDWSSSNAARFTFRERFKNFNICFEDIYRIQTAWKVSDPQLREELCIFISDTVIPAYRSFLGRFDFQLESGRHAGKFIKYSPEDLDGYLLDLFEGTPRTLHHKKN